MSLTSCGIYESSAAGKGTFSPVGRGESFWRKLNNMSIRMGLTVDAWEKSKKVKVLFSQAIQNNTKVNPQKQLHAKQAISLQKSIKPSTDTHTHKCIILIMTDILLHVSKSQNSSGTL